jgi:hypothetical protein
VHSEHLEFKGAPGPFVATEIQREIVFRATVRF